MPVMSPNLGLMIFMIPGCQGKERVESQDEFTNIVSHNTHAFNPMLHHQTSDWQSLMIFMRVNISQPSHRTAD